MSVNRTRTHSDKDPFSWPSWWSRWTGNQNQRWLGQDHTATGNRARASACLCRLSLPCICTPGIKSFQGVVGIRVCPAEGSQNQGCTKAKKSSPQKWSSSPIGHVGCKRKLSLQTVTSSLWNSRLSICVFFIVVLYNHSSVKLFISSRLGQYIKCTLSLTASLLTKEAKMQFIMHDIFLNFFSILILPCRSDTKEMCHTLPVVILCKSEETLFGSVAGLNHYSR